MPTLNQWLGSFLTESRAEIFSQCRQDCPLLPLINKSGFHALREEKIGQKPPALQPPNTPQEANTTTNRPPSSHYGSISSPSILSLSFTTFSSSSYSRLRPLAPLPTSLQASNHNSIPSVKSPPIFLFHRLQLCQSN
jgi:hypothetical protein